MEAERRLYSDSQRIARRLQSVNLVNFCCFWLHLLWSTSSSPTDFVFVFGDA